MLRRNSSVALTIILRVNARSSWKLGINPSVIEMKVVTAKGEEREHTQSLADRMRGGYY